MSAAVASGSKQQYSTGAKTLYDKDCDYKNSGEIYFDNLSFPSGVKTYTFTLTYSGRSAYNVNEEYWLGFTDRVTVHERAPQYYLSPPTLLTDWKRTYTVTKDLSAYHGCSIRVDHATAGHWVVTYTDASTAGWKTI